MLNILNFIILKNNEMKKIDISLNNHLKNLDTHFKLLLYSQNKIAKSIYQLTISNNAVLELFEKANSVKDNKILSKIKMEVKNLLKNKYQLYKQEGVDKYDFIFPNNTTFLSMDKSNNYDDDLLKTRLDLKWANRYKKEISGFYYGKTSLMFRNIFPIYSKNKQYLGLIDIGFSRQNLFIYLSEIAKLDIHFIINKNTISSKIWTQNSDKEQYIQSNEHKDYLLGVTSKSEKEHYIKSKNKLEEYKSIIDKNINKGKSFNFVIKYNNRYQVVSFLVIKSNINNKVLAWLVSYSYDNNIDLAILDNIKKSILIFIFLLILFIFIYKLIKQKQLTQTQYIKTSKALKKAKNFIKKNKQLANDNLKIKNLSEENMRLYEQYNKAVDSALIVSKGDLRGIITFVNENFIKISGYSKDELIGYPHNILRDPNQDKSIYKNMWETIQNKKTWQGILSNQKKDGTLYYVNTTIYPIVDIKGDTKEYISIRHDITEQIRLENRKKYLLKRTKFILNSQESMIIIANEKEIIEANKKLFELSGFEDLITFKKYHSCICELFIKKDGYLKDSDIKSNWSKPIFKDQNKIHKALIKDKNNNEIIFEVKGKHIILNDERLTIFTFSNITNIEKMREKAEASKQAKSDFLANMSHEIRTPMNGISGFLQLLEKSELNKKQEKYLDIIKTSMDMLLVIINNILDFSKLESGKMISELRHINPFIELEKSFMNFIPKANEKNISYQIHINNNLEESYMMDSLHITQVMQNLINNAIKFTPNDGTVIVKVDKIDTNNDTDIVKFSVLDSGIGIAKNKQRKILEPFSQADNSTSREFGGTGLGLSISKSLVELMGGTLELNSQENKGSEFYFQLKLKKSKIVCLLSIFLKNKIYLIDNNDKLSQIIKKQLNSFNLSYIYTNINTILEDIKPCDYIISTNKNDFNKLNTLNNSKAIYVSNLDSVELRDNNINIIKSYKNCPSKLYNKLLSLGAIIKTPLENKYKDYDLNILIADDYEINRILIGEILEQYKNINYVFVVNGKEALEIIHKENNFNMVLMDINMPIMDGKEATIQIRKLGINIPIIALTANALKGDKEKFVRLGMDDYISKPIKITELERVLDFYSNISINKANKTRELIYYNSSNLNYVDKAIEETINKTNFSKDVVLKLFNSYINSLDELLKKYKLGLENNDLKLIENSAHDIKSSSLILNFDEIGLLAKDIEYNANNNEEFKYEECYNNFIEHFNKIKKYLNKGK